MQSAVTESGMISGVPAPPVSRAARFYAWDHLGTVRVVMSPDLALIERHDYEPFGVEIRPAQNSAGNTHQYTGHERDLATGMDYMHFRYYGGNLARFMKPDYLTACHIDNPQTWNLYTYVRNNPGCMLDPDGKDGLSASEYMSAFAEAAAETADEVAFKVAYPALKIESGILRDDPKEMAVGTGMITIDALLQGGFSKASSSALGWTSRDNLLIHFEEHAAEFGSRFIEQYAQMAKRFIATEGKDGVESVTMRNGMKLMYNKATKEFAVLNKEGKIITYHKANLKYWLNQLKRIARKKSSQPAPAAMP